MNLPFHIDLSAKHSQDAGPNPPRDWLTLLGIVFVLLLVSVGANIYFYHQAVTGAPLSGKAPQAAALNTDLVTQVQSVFAARAVEAGKYQSGGYSFIDPSK